MATIELHHNGVFVAKVATATIGHEPGDRTAFLIAGPVPDVTLPPQYALVIHGLAYPIKALKLGPDGHTVNAELA